MTTEERLADARRKLETAEAIIEHSAAQGLTAVNVELITALLTPTRKALADINTELTEGDDVNVRN